MPAVIRYILFDLIKIFLMSLVVLTALFLFFDVVKELHREGLGLAQILWTIPFLLPFAIRTSSHGALLFAVCSVYGRMAAANEIVAIKSMGISPMKVIWPALWLSLPLSFAGVWLDELGTNWGMAGVERVIVNFTDEMAYTTLRANRSFLRKHFSIAVKCVEGRTLIRPAVSYKLPDESVVVTIVAQDGELRVDQRNSRLQILLRNGKISVPNEFDMSFEDTIEPTLQLDTSFRAAAVTPKRIAEQKARVASLKKDLAAQTAKAGDHPTADRYQTLLQRYQTEERSACWMEAKLHLLWANSFCCVAFVAIGVPVAITLRRGDFMTSFALCIVPIVAAYQPLQFVGCSLAQSGQMPAWTVWFGDVILLSIGVWLLRRVVNR